MMLMIWYTFIYTVKIPSNSGPVSYKWWKKISEFNVGRNDIFEEYTLFGYPGEEYIIQLLTFCVLLAKYFIYTNKLNGNNTLELYSYLVLLKNIHWKDHFYLIK